MMRARAWSALAAVLVLWIMLSGWKVARSVADFARAPAAAREAGLARPRDVPIRVEAGGPLAELAALDRAIVFVYAPGCAVGAANMANWTELVRAARGGPARLVAVAPERTAAARAYWGGLAREVRVLAAPPAAVREALGVESTPVTLLVERGRIRGELTGALTAPARAQVLRFARTGALQIERR
jgi:hypothetical protein